jgi:hypothetical protein
MVERRKYMGVDATPNVRIYDPWGTYKEWKAGEASLTQLLAVIGENAVGLATAYALMGWRHKATQHKERAERAYELLKEREMLASDESFLATIETLIEAYRPTLRLFPPERHQRRGHYWTSVQLQIDKGARGIYYARADAEGKPPRAEDPVWAVYRKREYPYHGQLERLEGDFTRRAAVERMQTIAKEHF